MTNKLKLLDTTLRDGSYVVDFQFTARDHAIIVSRLDAANVPFIEIGHGLGLGAGRRPDMRSPEPDEAYFEAVAACNPKNYWGAFFIPGIGTLADIDLAAKYGMKFLRVGTNVTEVKQSEPYIRRAKDCGMYVFANYMKTYAVSPKDVAKCAVQSQKFGADLVCIVDSAGGMFPDDVAGYIKSIRAVTDVEIGFHGHNNLGMANANALKAAELGVNVVDTSIRGMGRSAGNTVTEIFLLSLKRKNIDLGIDVGVILDTAEKYIDPLLSNYNQVNSIGIISGYAQFHSSFLSRVLSYSRKHKVDPRELIVRLTAVDKINAPDELLERLCNTLKIEQSQKVYPSINAPVIDPLFTSVESLRYQAAKAASHARIAAKKVAGISVFNLVQGIREKKDTYVSPTTNQSDTMAIASAEIYSVDDLNQIIQAIDGQVDYILLDVDVKVSGSKNFIELTKKSASTTPILQYSDLDVWARATVRLACQLLDGLHDKRISFLGNSLVKPHLLRAFEVMGANAVSSLEAELIVLAGYCPDDIVKLIDGNAKVLDAWVGGLSDSLLNEAHKKNVPIYRVDMHDTIRSEFAAALADYRKVSMKLGIRNLDGIDIASGGYVAPEGTIIVDSINNPTRVLGIADGNGRLRLPKNYTTSEVAKLQKIEQSILLATPPIDNYGA